MKQTSPLLLMRSILLIDGHQFPYNVYAPDSTWDNMDATLSDPLVNGQEIRWLEQQNMGRTTTQNPEYPIIRGKALPPSQKWCVG
jgi:hypothetical protein